ncbi:uncharacterized protein TNCV_1756481 [Trichonephila clavipes]|nr:uncharacterized protein TNCV_1756481 [Trichonephila clavipes]
MVFRGYLCVPFGSCFSRMEGKDVLGIFLRSLWPKLHCRWRAVVSPLMSIGWRYLSSLSLKRHCCRVSASDKEWWVYSLDPRPDAVTLYTGGTPGKLRAWFLPDDWYTASLVSFRVRWRHTRMKLCFAHIGPIYLCSGNGIDLPNFNLDNIATHVREGRECSKLLSYGCPQVSRTAESIEKGFSAVSKKRLQTIAKIPKSIQGHMLQILTKDPYLNRVRQHIVPRILNEGQESNSNRYG